MRGQRDALDVADTCHMRSLSPERVNDALHDIIPYRDWHQIQAGAPRRFRTSHRSVR
jgi:hypothetical protein